MQTAMVQSVVREPVVFEHALETLLAAARPLAPSTLAALERRGLSPSRPLQAAYPGAMWPEVIRLVATAMDTHGDTEAAEYALGQRFAECLRESKLGAAIHSLGRVVGAERMLLRMSRNIRTTNNFLDAVVTPRSEDTGWELLIRPAAEFARTPGLQAEPPHFVRGMLTTVLQQAGAPQVQVDLLHHDPVRATTTFRVML
ncbi:DUF2378 family protein [Pyxidicoccus fallax]|uniref:DUF2378 family protein n=1 Tax=Pyxidicoccus fallax TaxID=394095 RepID=A0A848LUJ4_9BACT|nr:DUF2378 family protein [Pyxidicoccus fallax]NMO21339.1 DUF2378 family protein [Pyxidicoccus fallax]NPC83572.1 DUF2378 family protein [Pyxidicoccus fallax]